MVKRNRWGFGTPSLPLNGRRLNPTVDKMGLPSAGNTGVLANRKLVSIFLKSCLHRGTYFKQVKIIKMEKTKNHTGFRNGDLFCFNCGTSQKLPLPMPAELAGEWMKGFDKVHKDCPKTFDEPIADPSIDYSEEEINKNAHWWLVNGERGTSSETMFYYFTGRRIGKHETTPSDPDDFRRCYLLLKAVPQWKKELHKLKVGGEVWSKLVDNWDKLTDMLEEQMKTKKVNGMYEFMKSIGC